MSRSLGVALAVTIALLVPGVLIANSVRLLANHGYVKLVYDHGGLGDDPYGLSKRQRTELGLTGLDSILPRGSIDALRDARLPSGAPAFDARELRHMEDVRRIVGPLLVGELIAIATIVLLALVLVPLGAGRLVPASLRAGAILTLGLGAFVGALLVIEPDWLSTGFHTLFFQGSSWRFAETETLRRLYPERFWTVTSVVLAVATALQAVLLGALSHLWLGGRRRRARAELSSSASRS
jgi:Protein of unknown function (DUF1461)